jgi:hypothetical protein
MIVATLLLLASDVPQALLDRSDEAAGAYVSCLFAVSRQAHAAGLSVESFEQRLAGSCLAEERMVRQIGNRILALRGKSNPGASTDALIGDMRRRVIADYRALPAQERALQDLERICQEKPEACRP